MKKVVFVCVFLIIFTNVFSQEVSLDQAIKETVEKIANSLPAGATLAVTSVIAPKSDISGYIWDNLEEYFTDIFGNKFKQRKLDDARKEIRLNDSYEFDDATVQRMGSFASAEVIVVVNIEKQGKHYRMTTRAIRTEKNENVAVHIADVKERDINKLTDEGDGVGKKLVYGVLNPVFGLGSYLQGDGFSGGLLTAGYVVSGTLILVELLAFDYWDKGSGVFGTIGLGIAAPCVIWGFLRPFFYDKKYNHLANLPDNFKIDIVPASNDGIAVKILYSVKF